MNNEKIKENITYFLVNNNYLKASEKQNEYLSSKSFSLLVLEKTLFLNHNKIKSFEKYVIDGSEDNGIDIIYLDNAHTLHIFQTKFSPRTNLMLTNVKSFKTSVDQLLNGVVNSQNKELISDTLGKWNKCNDKNRSVKCYFANISKEQESWDSEIISNKNQIINEMKTYNDSMTSYNYMDLENVMEWISPFSVVSSVEMKFNKELTIFKDDEDIEICNSVVSAKDLIKNLGKFIENETLFSANLRGTLKKNKITTSIINTIKTDSNNFIKYNNGITIVCEEIRRNNNCVYTLEKFSIVNGAQTISSLYQANEMNLLQDDCYVMVKILRANEEVMNKISLFSNTQNTVKEFDKFSFHPLNKNLYKRFLLKGYVYEFRRGVNVKKNRINDNLIKAEIVLRIVSCFLSKDDNNDLSFVLSSCKNNFNKLYNDENSLWEKTRNFLENDENMDTIISLYKIFEQLKKFLKLKMINGNNEKIKNSIEYLLFVIIIKEFGVTRNNFQYLIEANIENYINKISDKIDKMFQNNVATYKTTLGLMKSKIGVLELINEIF